MVIDLNPYTILFSWLVVLTLLVLYDRICTIKTLEVVNEEFLKIREWMALATQTTKAQEQSIQDLYLALQEINKVLKVDEKHEQLVEKFKKLKGID